jgi:hypothetical protein
MNRLQKALPPLLVIALCGLMLAHGPIPQLAHYHEFADQSVMFGVPHAADVLSNIGFFFVALWGLVRLWPAREHAALKSGWPGYRLFLTGLLLTAIGSSFYHLAPDNARLIWDRLPIALACAGLLAAVRAETQSGVNGNLNAAVLGLFAIASVAWWAITDLHGAGDLRPYLLLQGLPLVLIPLWQAIYKAPNADRLAFAAALLVYIVAKIAEVNDHQILNASAIISGHTLKHLLATAAAGIMVARLKRRIDAK